MKRVVILGATGYTGRLVAGELVRQGRDPVLAGRNPERLAALAASLGGQSWRQADVTTAGSVRALVDSGDVLISTVGPFTRWGEPAVAAAVDAGATYLDSTGEPAFIRRVFDGHGPSAERAGVALLPACGYDFVPGSLAAALALERAGRAATRVDVGYFVAAGDQALRISAGTRNSGPAFMLGKSFAWRDGRLRNVRFAERERAFFVDGSDRRAVSVGGTEHLTLPRTFPQLREVNVYLGWFGALSPVLRAGSAALAPVLMLPSTRAALTRLGEAAAGRGGRERQAPETTALGAHEPLESDKPPVADEPDDDNGASRIVATAHSADGRQLARVDLRGSEPYAFTGAFLAWAAGRALEGRIGRAGALGPLEAFGLADLAAGCAQAGLTLV